MQSPSQYTLTAVLHVGAAHVLHRGYRNADRTPVVVKRVKGDYPTVREIARLRHELLISRLIDDPGVVKAYELETTSLGPALILEDFGGRPLSDLLRQRRPDLDAALGIASALAGATAAIHERHIIHKDIKPENVLVNAETGAVKIADFGIATRLSQETQKAARPDALEGTLAYMSPEQTGRTNRALDYRTDLYSLGVTLYEIFSGALPFSADDPLDLVHSHLARTPASLADRAGVPEVISAIVAKLLCKAAEDRYQSARGLKVDLDECRKRLQTTGEIAPFTLAQKDAINELRIVQRLHGRTRERALLLEALERARGGDAELVLISGDAGVGKSALAGELKDAIARDGGYFASGKFEQRGGQGPAGAIGAALRELVRAALAEPAEALARRKTAILAAVGQSGQLLVDLIPEIQILIGPQPVVPDLGPVEAQNRFDLVFQRFVRVFTAAGRPVAIFLDDLHWADAAQIRLLSLLLTDPERGQLLVAGAHRPQHDGAPGPDLAKVRADLRARGVAVREIALGPLDLEGAQALVADAVGAETDEVRDFAAAIFEKTQGNPLFLGQLLRTLHADGAITLGGAEGSFRFDPERVKAAMVTENVVDLMTEKLAKLAPHTRRAIVLAACIGYRFDLRTLSVIHETKPPETAASLWEALEVGLVVPLDAGYQLAAESDGQRITGTQQMQMFDLSYRFLHDRVQQAAYAMIEEPRRREVHLRIGRLLREKSDAAQREERLLEIVDHLNLGAGAIDDPAERIDLAHDNLTAGRRSLAATAYDAAAGYFAAGVALLDEESWSDEYALAFDLHAELAECESLRGRPEEARRLFDRLLARARSRLDSARIYTLVVVLHIMRGELAAALREGRTGLALFGVDLPETEEALQAACDAELEAVRANLARRSPADLIEAPLLTDPSERAKLELLLKLSPAAFFSGPTITGLVGAMPVNLCLEHGLSDLSALTYGGFGYLLIVLRGWYEEARTLFRVGMALAERSTDARIRAHTDVFLLGPAHFFIHLHEALPLVTRAQRAGLEAGDFVFLSFACYHDIQIRLAAGFDLASIEEDLERCFGLVRRTRNDLTHATLIVARQLLAALGGRTLGPTNLSSVDFDAAAHFAEAEAKGHGYAIAYHHFARLFLAVLYGDHTVARAEAARFRDTIGTAVLFHYATFAPFYDGLAIAGLYASAPAGDKDRLLQDLDERRAQIGHWAGLCPANYRHADLLLAAEAARITGKNAEARELYDQAIAAAQDGAFTHHEALASELAALFYLGRRQPKIARVYMDEARHGYLRWGATEKARSLLSRHGALLASEGTTSTRPSEPNTSTTTGDDGADLLDSAAMVRAAQAMVGEIVLDRLLDRLMRVLVVNAGADRGVLLLSRGDQLVVAATMTVDPDVVTVGIAAPPDVGAGIAESVIAFVERTREPVVLGDTTKSSPFSGDAYLAAKPPRSLLSLAMVNQGRLTGVLYLENHVAREAFPPSRVELSSLLASHAAIAVENAILIDELRRRTDELGESNRALGETNDRLARELHEHEQAEAARAALKEELYRVQTPLIPITERIMAMPLIGAIDAERARQILETALRGVAESRAAVVILDVTGVDAVDAGVTGTLVSTANALRLLGAHAVITGIKPEVARELVSIGVDLGALVTRGTLQGGIAYAMERLGGRRRL